MSCKRCGGRNLYPSDDPDYVCCYNCGPVFVGSPLDIPLKWVQEPKAGVNTKRKDLEPSLCIDCQAHITQGAKRCKPCASVVLGIANRGDSRLAHHKGRPIILGDIKKKALGVFGMEEGRPVIALVVCSVEGCPGERKIRGLCRKHYKAHMKAAAK